MVVLLSWKTAALRGRQPALSDPEYTAGRAVRPTKPRRPVSEPIPFRLSADGRVATWNPGMIRAAHVVVVVRADGGGTQERQTMNSGRARVREGERIEAIRSVP
jgi:hypothetical protein